MTVAVNQYNLEANQALLEKLERALNQQDWNEVEAVTLALYDFARLFTVPSKLMQEE